MESPSHEYAELTPKQIKALPFLAAGLTAVEVSKKLKISQQQISEWKRNPTFVGALRRARQRAFETVHEAFEQLAGEAVSTLHALLRNADTESVKLRAAMFVVEQLQVSRISQAAQSPTYSMDGSVDIEKVLAALGIDGGEGDAQT